MFIESFAVTICHINIGSHIDRQICFRLAFASGPPMVVGRRGAPSLLGCSRGRASKDEEDITVPFLGDSSRAQIPGLPAPSPTPTSTPPPTAAGPDLYA